MNILAQTLINTHKFIAMTLTSQIIFMASKMQASSTQKTKDSAGRRLGLKKFGGEQVYPNDIVARQRGFKWKPGKNIIVGKDHTLHAQVEGIVKFRRSTYRKVGFYFIDIEPQQNPNRTFKHPNPYIYHPQLFPDRASQNHLPLERVSNSKRNLQEIK